MPAVRELLVGRTGAALEQFGAVVSHADRNVIDTVSTLLRRVNVPSNRTSPAGLIEANTVDPWNKSGKYALAYVYFCIPLLLIAALMRYYHLFTDKIRTALHQEEVLQSSTTSSPDTDYELSVLYTDKSTMKFFPREGPLPGGPKTQSSVSSVGPINNLVAFFRFIFYRPVRQINIRKGWRPLVFPSLSVIVIGLLALLVGILYCTLPQPLFWESIAYGSPPLAVRSGMMAVALLPWIVALSSKANLITMVTGISHERLNVLHRWAAYICLVLSILHVVPFYITPIWEDGARHVFEPFFARKGFYVYGTGLAAFVPLCFLCLHSIAPLRHRMYELFVALHVPVAIVFLGMMFWHCNNYLTSWHYLLSTVGIWLLSYIMRLFYLNWTRPGRLSWLIGDEAAITLMPENAIKVTIPTQMKWRPGQYIYLRMPGISVFENHPFTIASLCDDDFPSEYGEGYKDMVLVFRPFGGFTKKVLQKALEHGPWHTYRAFVDGPYGGMQRRIEAFEDVVLIAGGSGITAIVSQLLTLIKKMRDGKAVTRKIHVIWALKRPETMEWFKEELRICREYAPPETVECQFYITAAKRNPGGTLVSAKTPTRPVSLYFHDKVNGAFQNIADHRLSGISSKRHSALIRDEAQGDPEKESELRRENEDNITALPQAHFVPVNRGYLAPPRPSFQSSRLSEESSNPDVISPVPQRSLAARRQERNLSLDISQALQSGSGAINPDITQDPTEGVQGFDFGFPSTPTEFQKNLMRFAFLPAAVKKKDGWSTEYGRPDIPYLLKGLGRNFGRRTCVFVCGPPSMRVSVSETVAQMQRSIWSDSNRDEIFLHTENYAL
ncbi:metalloreductase-like protein transmembrane component [Cucurbitaria berberidis CBS 394.84]|uniref:ferric-chelate reductase (NADPH) n=1 Tax=Cucurbitaria berberidis CBS 394.84 TaxID=1168544 RepID=A0A9P4GUL4_9PLEO|nr:metalloreductase-like protein transmembrane component [Cucurbitaria berberidis CBS 394.84]KAF1851650.1 metalloreductase-like protein transmembrane component [Cucurbitaria berberidis CBS 394.84]